MTSIIPIITPPAIAANVAATIVPASGTVIAAGTTFYGRSAFTNLFQNYSINGFNNAGVLWNESTLNVSSVLSGYYIYGVVNSGTWVGHSDDGNAYGLGIGSGGDTVVNSGQMFALTARGNALGISSFAPDSVITNSGTIAAQALAEGAAGVGDAVAIALYNGGHIVNAVGGAILGEGVYGRAILMGRGTLFNDRAEIINHGLIAAQTVGGAHESVAITFEHLTVESARIVNDGTIRGDIAIQANQTGYDPYFTGGAYIQNLAGGAIYGRLDIRDGDDRLVNAGAIYGNVSTGTGNDVFDTVVGSWNGTADLGWGNDQFFGSAASDVVKGGRNADTLTGNGGNDLLLGGTGNDTLTGGAGNDGLYGESGDDRIVTQGGDAAFGGDGNDVIRAGDLSFARIDGGAGADTLELDVGGVMLDLTRALAAGRLSGIETIALGAGQQIALRGGDATTLAGAARMLTFTGDASDRIMLVGAWSQGADRVQQGVTFHAYMLNGETILVAGAIAVSLNATPSAGFGGLDAIAAGSAAPVAGSVAGGELTNAVQTDVGANISGTFTIDADETWVGVNRSLIGSSGYSAVLVNHGVLSASADSGAQSPVFAVSGQTFDGIVNTGTIRVSGSGSAYVYGIDSFGEVRSLVNSGRIEAVTEAGMAQGAAVAPSASNGAFSNSGAITATATTGIAVALQLAPFAFASAVAPIGTNAGMISATGGTGTVALQLLGSGRFVNEAGGTITAANSTVSGARDAVGVQIFRPSNAFADVTLENRGTISATVAVAGVGGPANVINSGSITGEIRLGASDDTVLNSGTITGAIGLGAGRDSYDGSRGVHQGFVFGEDGSDLLIAGVGDTLNGGADDDVLVARGGSALTGGEGRDVFVFTARSATPDQIVDFVSGTDRIDLSALMPMAVSITVDGRMTTVTATAAAGPFTLQVVGTVAQSDILTRAADFTGTADADTLVATGFGSTLRGLAGDDVLVGISGNDTLDGGAGADLLMGGDGDDIYIFDSFDTVRESAGGGYDTLIITPGAYVTLPDNVEKLMGGGGIGNALDNLMIGSDGNDFLSGAGGNDTMIGGLGNDSYTAEGQNDLVVEDVGGGSDSINTFGSLYLYANVETLTLAFGAGDIFGVGNDLANVLTGNEGANLLIAGSGADVVRGGAGADALFGQDGADQLFGEAGVDYLVGGAGDDLIDGGNGADALYGEDGDDTLYGGSDFVTDILVGGAGNDVLRGDDGLGDYDLMDGGAGDDIYYVDTPADLTFEALGGGSDTVHADIVGAGYYLYANVENLILDGTTPFGVGNALDNRMTGNAQGNYLLGGAGNDTLNGKGGNDVLFGESGADTFVFERGTGGDVIGDFVAGTDRIDLSAFGFTSFASLQSAIGQNGTDSFINLGGGDLVVLNGVAMTSLNAGDFILSGTASAPNGADGKSFDRSTDGADIDATSPADTLHGTLAHCSPFYSPLHLAAGVIW